MAESALHLIVTATTGAIEITIASFLSEVLGSRISILIIRPPTITPTAASTSTPAPCNPTFSDVLPGSTWHDYVTCLYCRGAIGGYPDGTFRPNNNMTRGQLAKVVTEASDFQMVSPSSATFRDVPEISTFYSYVETAKANELLGGYADGTFRPNTEATRGQICKVVNMAVNPPQE